MVSSLLFALFFCPFELTSRPSQEIPNNVHALAPGQPPVPARPLPPSCHLYMYDVLYMYTQYVDTFGMARPGALYQCPTCYRDASSPMAVLLDRRPAALS